MDRVAERTGLPGRKAGKAATAALAAIAGAVLLLGPFGAAAQIDVDNRGVRVDPSGPGSPEYERTIEERNRRQREAAEKAGGTHIDTTYGQFGEAPEASEPAGPRDAGDAARRPAEVPASGKTEAAAPAPAAGPAVEGPVYGGREEEVRQGELRELVGELLKALDRGPSVVRLTAPQEDAERAAPAPVPAASRPPAAGGLPAIGAGAGFYARVLYAVNSDFRGPVMIEILEPPLAGAVLTGAFERVREALTVRLSRMSWRGRESPVEAWAVGLDCACYGLDGEVDRHWWERLILPAAVRFAEGFLVARGTAGRRVEVSGETIVDERDAPAGRQAFYRGLGSAARSVGDILLQDAPAGPTVRIPRDTDVAVVFARPPGETAAVTGAAAAAVPRGPTRSGVVRRAVRPEAEMRSGRGAAPARADGGDVGG